MSSSNCLVYEMCLKGYEVHGVRLKPSRVAVRKKGLAAKPRPGTEPGQVLTGDVAEIFLKACEAAGIKIKDAVEFAKADLGVEEAEPVVTVQAWDYMEHPWPVYVTVGRDVVAEFYADRVEEVQF